MDEQEDMCSSHVLDRAKKSADMCKDDESSEAEHAALEGSVWRKLDRWILPLCAIFYILAFLDRTSVANARIAGLQESLKLTNHEYSIALTVTYVPYIATDLPSNLFLKRVGPNVMLPAMVTVWGVVSALQGVVRNYSELLACRFFLGLMEGGLFPGLVLYLSSFYPRKRLQIRVATVAASASLASAFSGLLAAAIDQINEKGGRPGWAWIFILEGTFTFVLGLVSFFLLPSSPERAGFLSEKERAYVVSRLKEDGAISQNDETDGFSWVEVIESARSPHVLLLVPALFFSGTVAYGMGYFGPTIVAGLGYTGNRAQLMSVPPFVTAFACAMISAFVSDRYRCRGWTAIFCSMISLIGFIVFYASESLHVRYGSLFLSVPGVSSIPPALSTWIANNSAPHIRRATSIAIGFIMANSGGILVTWLLGSLSPAPKFTKAVITLMIMSIGIIVFSVINLAYLSRENRLKAERRRIMTREEEPVDLGDRSAWFIYNL